MATKMIPIAEIEVLKGRRSVLASHVETLALSIAEVGLTHPIRVRRNGRGGYVLIAGAHRLAAVEKNGEYAIEASVAELDELRAELAEIDENILHRGLSAAAEAAALARKKAITIALNPDAEATAAPAAKARGKHPGGRRRTGADGNSATVAEFQAETAKATGQSERSIRRKVALGEALTDDALEVLGDAPVPAVTVAKVAALPAEAQPAAAAKAVAELQSDFRTPAPERDDLPKPLRGVWPVLVKRGAEAEKALKHARRCVLALLEEAKQAAPPDRPTFPKSAGRTLANAGRSLDEMADAAARCIPAEVCSACEGKGCARCSETGWLSEESAAEAKRREERGKAALANR